MSWVVWITGLPGSGKSTVALALKKEIHEAVILQMDILRKIVTPEPTFSDQERDCVYRSLVYMGKTLHSLGHNVIIDATGNRLSWRGLARKIIPEFCEVFLECPLEVCMERENTRIDTHSAPAGIYKKGRKGGRVPGLKVPYERSEHPELTISTEKASPSDAAKRIADFIRKNY